MKVHLTYDDDLYRAGWRNIDRFPRNDHQEEGDVADLSWTLDAGEASEIAAYLVLDRYPMTRRGAIVAGWTSRLAPRGSLTIVGADLHAIASKLEARRISVEDANAAIYGGDGPRGRIASLATLLYTEFALRDLGLKVVEARYEGDHYVVKGVRP